MLPKTKDMLTWTLEEVDAVHQVFVREFGSEDAAKKFMTDLLLLQIEQEEKRVKEDLLRN